MQEYVLLVDRDEDILELQETALKYFYGGEIVSVRSRDEVMTTFEKLGKPEIIIADLFLLKEGLHHFLKENGAYLPLIATLESKEKMVKPPELTLITSLLAKPVSPEELSHLVKSFTKAPHESPTHVPIKLKVACEVASGRFDIYLKLSGTNFVKITNKGVDFSINEAHKLATKGIYEVFLKASDSHEFLRVWERDISTRISNRPPTIDSVIAIECLEQVEKIAKAFGWSQDAVNASQKVIKDAVNSLNKEEQISGLLRKKLSQKNSTYTHHIGLLSYLTCIMCAQLKMEESQEKMVLASLMHDLALDENIYPDIGNWNKEASNLEERSPEVVRYRLHPLHAANLAQSMAVLPPDVDQIILQHHECSDGTGFPRGLTSGRIHFLASLFIIAEDLVHFLDDGEALETSLKDFLTWGEAKYQSGNFKKIFDGIKPKVN